MGGKNKLEDRHQAAAEQAFQKRKAYFSDPKRVPYPLQGDVLRMGNKSDKTKKAEGERLKGYGEEMRKRKLEEGLGDREDDGEQPDAFGDGSKSTKKKSADPNTPAFYRQRAALARQQDAAKGMVDDDDTKMLRFFY